MMLLSFTVLTRVTPSTSCPILRSNRDRRQVTSGALTAGTLQQLYNALYKLNVGVDFVFPSTGDFSQYKLLIVPSLYVADDALLKRISDYVHSGGHVLMTFKSGFTNENSAVRWQKAPNGSPRSSRVYLPGIF